MKDTIHPVFTQILKQERKRIGLLQYEMAKRIGIDQGQYSRCEAGILGVTRKTIERYLVSAKARKRKEVSPFVSQMIIEYEQSLMRSKP